MSLSAYFTAQSNTLDFPRWSIPKVQRPSSYGTESEHTRVTLPAYSTPGRTDSKDTRYFPTIHWSSNSTLQTNRKMAIDPNKAIDAVIMSRMEGLCQWCSRIPTDAVTFSGLPAESPSREVVPQKLEHSPCKFCRLIARAIPTLYYNGETYQLTWENVYDPKSRAIGTLTLMPNESGRFDFCLPVITVVPSDPVFLEDTMRGQIPELIDFGPVKQWIQDCELELLPSWSFPRSHKRCKQELPSALHAFRVIDCEERRIVDAPPECSFVALSYVWGRSSTSAQMEGSTPPLGASSKREKDGPLISLYARLFQHTENLPTELPRTIEDSIAVALLLGYRYIWIDRYVSRRLSEG